MCAVATLLPVCSPTMMKSQAGRCPSSASHFVPSCPPVSSSAAATSTNVPRSRSCSAASIIASIIDCQRRFVVDAAFAIERAILDGRGIGINAPQRGFVLGDGHRIDMRMQHDDGIARPQDGNGVLRFRFRFRRRRARIAADRAHPLGDESRDGARIAGRIGRGDAHQLLQQFNAIHSRAPLGNDSFLQKAIHTLRNSSGSPICS